MLTITEIPTMPTATNEGKHESVLRAYHILERVKDWLRRGVPGEVVLELVAEMEGAKTDDRA